ncbi:hypothetical protein [Limnohabitans sp.]|uniref:hypothetical protein n=1 Tax=Limnohabitans sp. TaxID=1907725 RepID=UPI00286EFF2D|nr:hypothetical protein [Limnohabitans sp.]
MTIRIYLNEPNTSHTTQALRSTSTTSNQLKIQCKQNTERAAMSVLCSTSERQFALNTFILPEFQSPKAIDATTAICKSEFATANAQQHLKSRTQAF